MKWIGAVLSVLLLAVLAAACDVPAPGDGIADPPEVSEPADEAADEPEIDEPTDEPEDEPPSGEPGDAPSDAEVGASECGTGTYQAEAVLDGGTWTARNGASTMYSGGDMLSAMQRRSTASHRAAAPRRQSWCGARGP